MKFSIVLMKSEPSTEDGFPIYARVGEKQQRPKMMVGRAWPEHFSADAGNVRAEHPLYDILAPKLMNYTLRAKRVILQGDIVSPRAVLDEILRLDRSSATLQEYFAEWKRDQEVAAAAFEKSGELKARNRVKGYLRSIENTMAQFNLCAPKIAVSDITPAVVAKFKKQSRMVGNKPATTALYLRNIRKLYNEAVSEYRIKNEKPFEGVFKDLKVKASAARKKYLDIETIRVLEGLTLGVQLGRARDYFLLQFYFGGCDLTDIYFMKRMHYRKGRVYFDRGKTEITVDVAVHPKAKAIIDRWAAPDGEYLFPGSKTDQAYKNYRHKYYGLLNKLQVAQNEKAKNNKKVLPIEVLPDGGNMGVKVARHTFGNVAKRLLIDDDLVRELMGHAREGVDVWYKDKFPEKMRDEALFKIIG